MGDYPCRRKNCYYKKINGRCEIYGDYPLESYPKPDEDNCPRFKPKGQNCFIRNRRGVSRRHDDDNHAIEYHSYHSGIY